MILDIDIELSSDSCQVIIGHDVILELSSDCWAIMRLMGYRVITGLSCDRWAIM